MSHDPIHTTRPPKPGARTTKPSKSKKPAKKKK